MYLRDYSWAAGGFYPTSASEAEKMISRFLAAPSVDIEQDRLMGGIAPHAGWVYSGPTAGRVFKALMDRSDPSLVICFGAVHIHGVRRAAVMAEGEWRTPLGNIPIDKEAARAILESLGDMAAVSNNPHEEEHSLEVILPFLKKCFPNAAMVPVMVSPDRNAAEIGRKTGQTFGGRNDVWMIGSTDMTH